MQIAAIFDPTTETETTFNTGFSNGTGRMVIYNESNQNLLLSWGSFKTYCPCWTAMLYCLSASTVKIDWVIQSTLVTSTVPPISQVIVEAYGPGEAITGTFPAALVRQTNIGNAVQTSVSTTQAIDNENNATGTSIIKSIVTGDGANQAVSLTNDAIMTLGDTAHPGSLTVAGPVTLDGTLTVDGALSLDNGKITTDGAGQLNLTTGILDLRGNQILNFTGTNTYLVVPGAAAINFNVNGSTVASVDSTGVNAPNGVNYNIGRIKDINNGINLAGTINHGLSGTPAAVMATCDSASSTQTTGADTYTSTQFSLRSGAGLNNRWLAYR